MDLTSVYWQPASALFTLFRMLGLNPDLVKNVILFDLLSEDVYEDYIEIVSYIRRYGLCYNGKRVGPFRECGHDRNEPLVKLTIWAKSRDATINFETHLLISENDGNSYWFFAGGRWRRCSDSDESGVRVLGPVDEANFNSKKDGFVVKEIGPGTIYEALQGLATENGNWEHHFRVLSFMFVDAALLNPVVHFVMKTFKDASDVMTYKQTVDDVVAKCPSHWKILSKAMHNLFPDYKLKKLPFWYLPPSTIADLQLPSADELDNADEGDEVRIIQAERLKANQIVACTRMIRVLCPRHLLVFDD